MFDTLSSVRAQEGQSLYCVHDVLGVEGKENLVSFTSAGDGTRCQMINFLYVFVFEESILDFCKCDVIYMGTAKSHR